MRGGQARISARLLGSRVLIPDIEDSQRLYSEGFYGKPLGEPKPRGLVEKPLVLDLVEAVYLAEKGVLDVVDEEGRRLTPGELREKARSLIPRFDYLYRVYSELRDAGYVVRSGLKFGADFAVYIHGPGIDHAPFLVSVLDYDESIDPLEIVKAGRLSHSVRKHFIIAAVDRATMRVTYLGFSWTRL